MTGSKTAAAQRVAAIPHVEYRTLAPREPLPAEVLAAVVFGSADTCREDPRCVRVGLKPLSRGGIAELWHATGPVRIGFAGPVRYSADAEHLLGAIELDERDYGGLAATAAAAYAAIGDFQASSSHPHLLRMWNYFDGINRGTGDEERYKQFCVGRATGLAARALTHHPAATAIGRRDGSPVLQVYWLAGRATGQALENPRQVSAFNYPRQYGPAAPRFSRAMLVGGRLLMISGTASVIGHASRHPGKLEAQVRETLLNLGVLEQRAHVLSAAVPPRLGAASLLKIYLRDGGATCEVEALLKESLPAGLAYMLLEADICRAELLVEIDCIHGA
ncbi:MAG TPA: hypothetical protein VMG11_13360 [Steroidobacteraceae bacterium]|nr:hypothetical protein [Steroidobacteraceae bacterium]